MENSEADARLALMHSGTSFGEKHVGPRDRAFSLMMASFKNSEQDLENSENKNVHSVVRVSEVIKEEEEE